MYLLGILAVGFYAFKVPERYFPGKKDGTLTWYYTVLFAMQLQSSLLTKHWLIIAVIWLTCFKRERFALGSSIDDYNSRLGDSK